MMMMGSSRRVRRVLCLTIRIVGFYPIRHRVSIEAGVPLVSWRHCDIPMTLAACPFGQTLLDASHVFSNHAYYELPSPVYLDS
eukprot:scaffold3118_cov64-Cylindrotheca_fusiformis.AAC.2